MADVDIKINRNGPLYVKGPVNLFDHKGNEVDVEGDEVFLCRCGGSTNKPFCDGTHSRIGFKGAVAAVEASESEGES